MRGFNFVGLQLSLGLRHLQNGDCQASTTGPLSIPSGNTSVLEDQLFILVEFAKGESIVFCRGLADSVPEGSL